MPEHYMQESGYLYVTDPSSGEIVNSHQVPEYIENSPEYGAGIDYLRANADKMRVTLYFVQHDFADNLGADFERYVDDCDVLALEDNGWQDKSLERYQFLAAGGSIEELIGQGDLEYMFWEREVQNPNTYFSRLAHAIQASGKTICIADRKLRADDPYSSTLDWLYRSSEKYWKPGRGYSIDAHREWIMLAALGSQLQAVNQKPEETIRVLFPVGAAHFFLFDKLLALGIVADQEMVSGNAGTHQAEPGAAPYRALGNIGRMLIQE